MRVVGYLRGLSEGYAICSDDAKFEVEHQRDVAYFAERLAFERHLDGNVALMIAYGHDLGRLKSQVMGFEHAKVGSKIVKNILKEHNIQKDTIDIVTDAIKKHNVKDQINNDYSELIKDADSLAHKLENAISNENAYEWARVKVAQMGEVTVKISEADAWFNAFESHYLEFVESWNLSAFDADPRKWIHATRIKIRKIRSLIKLFADLGMGEYYDSIDRTLSRAFKMLAKARMIHVMMDHQEKLSSQNAHKTLEHILSKALISVRDSIGKISFDKIDFEFPYDANFSDRIPKYLHRYLRKVVKLDFNDAKRVHKVRILGKTIKDWFSMGLISSEQNEFVSAIDKLHNNLGEFNDLHEIMTLPDISKYFDKDRVKAAVRASQDRNLETVFIFKLLNRKKKDHAAHYPTIIMVEN